MNKLQQANNRFVRSCKYLLPLNLLIATPHKRRAVITPYLQHHLYLAKYEPRRGSKKSQLEQ